MSDTTTKMTEVLGIIEGIEELDGVPSILLSEGFCPVGHGSLERNWDRGWCGRCGLNFAIVFNKEWPEHRLVEITLDSADDSEMLLYRVYNLDQFDDILWLDMELLCIRKEMERANTYTSFPVGANNVADNEVW